MIESDERQGVTLWVDLKEELNDALFSLSYDLAVLYANYVIDRGLRGNEAMEAFRDE